jgi:hypothetical protein
MHQGFTSERRQEIAQDGLTTCHPCHIGKVALLDRLLVDHDGNVLLWLLLIAGEEVV